MATANVHNVIDVSVPPAPFQDRRTLANEFLHGQRLFRRRSSSLAVGGVSFGLVILGAASTIGGSGSSLALPAPSPRTGGLGRRPGFRSCRPSGCRRHWRSTGSCRPAPYAAPSSQDASATPCRASRFPRPLRSRSCRQTLATVRAMATRLVGVASSTRRSNAHSQSPASCSSAAVRKCSPGIYMTT